MSNVTEEIKAERAYQDGKWGTGVLLSNVAKLEARALKAAAAAALPKEEHLA